MYLATIFLGHSQSALLCGARRVPLYLMDTVECRHMQRHSLVVCMSCYSAFSTCHHLGNWETQAAFGYVGF